VRPNRSGDGDVRVAGLTRHHRRLCLTVASPAEYQRAWKARNPDRLRLYRQRLDRQHLRARWAVATALRAGRLVRPRTCSECGRAPGRDQLGRSLIEAHHEDHGRPLDVRWLCRRCHRGGA